MPIEYFSFYMPNAFSPNRDGLNEAFHPIGYGIEHYWLSIYNRWGEQIFKARDKGWDGTIKNQTVPDRKGPP